MESGLGAGAGGDGGGKGDIMVSLLLEVLNGSGDLPLVTWLISNREEVTSGLPQSRRTLIQGGPWGY